MMHATQHLSGPENEASSLLGKYTYTPVHCGTSLPHYQDTPAVLGTTEAVLSRVDCTIQGMQRQVMAGLWDMHAMVMSSLVSSTQHLL